MKVVGIALLVLGAVAENPINAVVAQLRDMKGKASDDAAAADKAWEEKTVWCATEKQAGDYNVADGNKAIDSFTAKAQKATAEVAETSQRIVDLGAELAQNSKDMAEADKMEKDRQATFNAEESEMITISSQLVKAAELLRKSGGSGSAGSQAGLKNALMQVAQSLEVVMSATTINTASKQRLTAMLQSATEEDEEEDAPAQGKVQRYVQHSTGILDMIAQLKAQNDQDLTKARMADLKAKNAAQLNQQSLKDASAVAQQAKDDAEAQKARAEEDLASANKNNDEAKATLASDSATLQSVNEDCAAREAEHNAAVKSRSAETAAIDQAIQILTTPDFQAATGDQLGDKGFLSFAQMDPDARSEAADTITAVARRYKVVQLAQLAVQVRAGPFDKVMGMISDMISKLEKQQAEEQSKKGWCDNELATNTAKAKKLDGKIQDRNARIEKAEAQVGQLKEDVANLGGEIAALNKGMADATKIRNDESAVYAKASSDYTIGLEGLSKAIAVLREYYGSSGDAHGKQNDNNSGVISMLETTQSKMESLQADSELAEASASREYTKLKQDSEVSLASKNASVTAKRDEQARLTNAISDLVEDRDGKDRELTAVTEYLGQVRNECTHKVQSFEERASALKAEIKGLENALSILEGAGDGAEGFLQRRRA